MQLPVGESAAEILLDLRGQTIGRACTISDETRKAGSMGAPLAAEGEQEVERRKRLKHIVRIVLASWMVGAILLAVVVPTVHVYRPRMVGSTEATELAFVLLGLSFMIGPAAAFCFLDIQGLVTGRNTDAVASKLLSSAFQTDMAPVVFHDLTTLSPSCTSPIVSPRSVNNYNNKETFPVQMVMPRRQSPPS